jgi:thiamine biosynthesis protein ThiS
MNIKINGETRTVEEGATLAAVMESLQIPAGNLAIEHNGEFLDDGADLGDVTIKAGDTLEIVRFVGGG